MNFKLSKIMKRTITLLSIAMFVLLFTNFVKITGPTYTLSANQTFKCSDFIRWRRWCIIDIWYRYRSIQNSGRLQVRSGICFRSVLFYYRCCIRELHLSRLYPLYSSGINTVHKRKAQLQENPGESLIPDANKSRREHHQEWTQTHSPRSSEPDHPDCTISREPWVLYNETKKKIGKYAKSIYNINKDMENSIAESIYPNICYMSEQQHADISICSCVNEATVIRKLCNCYYNSSISIADFWSDTSNK